MQADGTYSKPFTVLLWDAVDTLGQGAFVEYSKLASSHGLSVTCQAVYAAPRKDSK